MGIMNNKNIMEMLNVHGFKYFKAQKNKGPSIPKGASWKQSKYQNSWDECGKMVGAIIPKNIVIIDLDRHEGKEDGVKAFGEVMKEFNIMNSDINETFIVKTPSNGIHLYYIYNGIEEIQTHPLENGSHIEVKKYGGYIIAPCSDGYNAKNNNEIIELPEHLLNWIKKLDRVQTDDIIKVKGSLEELREILPKIPVKDFSSNKQWLSFMQAAKSYAGDSLEINKELHEWSMGDKDYLVETKEVLNRIKSIRPASSKKDITVRTFYHYCSKYGIRVTGKKSNYIEDGKINDIEKEFFENPSHALGADILNYHLNNYIFEPSYNSSSGSFYYRKDGNAFYEEVLKPRVVARDILEKAVDNYYCSRYKDNTDKNTIQLCKDYAIAKKRIRTKSFLESVLALYSEIIIKSPVPKNCVPEVIPLLDKLIDFSGKTPIYRDPFPEEYFFDPINLYASDVKKAINTPNYDNLILQLFPDKDTAKTARLTLSLMVANKGIKYFSVWYGPHGNNGKNFLMDFMIRILGDRATVLKNSIILKNGDKSERRFAEIELRGKTVGFLDEIGGSFDTAQIKRLQNESYIRGENKGEKAIEFPQTWILVALTNELPKFYPATDMPFIDRLLILPFNSVFYRSVKSRKVYLDRQVKPENLHKAKEKTVLMKLLMTEQGGIILKLILDYIKLRDDYNGQVPESKECRQIKEQYIKDNDLFGKFYEEVLVEDPNGFISNQLLFEKYREFSGRSDLSIRKLGDNLLDQSKLIKRVHNGKGRGFTGISLS